MGGILVAPAPAVNVDTNDPGEIASLNQLTDIAVQSEPWVMVAGLDSESFEALGGVTDLGGNKVDFSGFSDSEVLLSETGSEKLDAQVGDNLVVMFNNQPVTLTVAAIAKDSVLTGLTATLRYSWLRQDGAAQTATQLRAYLNYDVRF